MSYRYLNAHKTTLALLAYVLIGAVLAYGLRGLRFDDPFITYRYAENLAAGNGFSFNPGEPVLITTAPLYALILALARVAGAGIPQTSYFLGSVALIVAAGVLYFLGKRHAHATCGWIAGLFLLVFPLSWLTMGFETPLFLACALLAFLTVDAGKYTCSGLLAAAAIGLRGDGFIVLAIVALYALQPDSLASDLRSCWSARGRLSLLSVLQRRLLNPLKVCLLTLVVYAPLAIWLTLRFGSPLPTTLLTKSAQAVSGLTGFYPYTSFIAGGWLLLEALVAQSAGMLIVLALAIVGIYVILRFGFRGLFMPVLWGLLHLAGYTVLSVAPYVWYYAPALPGLACLVALGIEALVFRLLRGKPTRWSLVTQAGLALVCAASMLVGVGSIVAVLDGATPPAPADLRAKLLPETKVDIYRQVGQWVHDHTLPDATLGVTELGVMSYYAQRHTIDFLGLVQPQFLAAIRHGDYLQSLIREQPGYVALTSENAIYDFDPQQAAWFRAVYTPVATFTDTRFWGSPLRLYQRTIVPAPITLTLDAAAHDLGDGWQVTGVRATTRSATGGKPVFLQLQLKAGKPLGIRTLRVQPVLIAGGDGLPVTSRLVFTSQWREGESDWLDFPFVAPLSARKGGYVVEANWLEGGPVVRAGTLKVPLDEVSAPDTKLSPLSQGVGVWHLAQPVAICAGTSATFTLYWRGSSLAGHDLTAFVQMRVGDTVLAQADAPPHSGDYPTSLWSPGEVVPDVHTIVVASSVAPGTYVLIVGLYDPADNTRLAVEDSPDRTPDGGVHIGQVVVKSCNASTK